MARLEFCGQLLFRTRDYLFPVLMAIVMLIWPPVPIDTVLDKGLLGIGLLLITSGQALRIITIGLDYIKRGGKNGRFYAPRLVTGGVFGHCRNPMYTGNVAIATGFFCVAGNPYAVVFGALASTLIYAVIIHSEECYLARTFGDAYKRYRIDVPRWIPRPRALIATVASFGFDWPAVIVREYGTLLTTALITLAILEIKTARAGYPLIFAKAYGAAALCCLVLYSIARYLKKSRRLRGRRG